MQELELGIKALKFGNKNKDCNTTVEAEIKPMAYEKRANIVTRAYSQNILIHLESTIYNNG